MYVVVALARFFFGLMFSFDDVYLLDNGTLANYFKVLFNYPIYLFNSWGSSNTEWLTFDAWLSSQGIIFDYRALLSFILAFIVLIGIVLGIFNLIKKCLSLGRL